MSIELKISSVFARYAGNNMVIPVTGNTVGECLQDLKMQYPELGNIFLDENGNLLRSFDIYINDKSAYPDEMKKPVVDGDKLNIMPVIYGG
jgi:molybdopterin converting factor small subunit